MIFSHHHQKKNKEILTDQPHSQKENIPSEKESIPELIELNTAIAKNQSFRGQARLESKGYPPNTTDINPRNGSVKPEATVPDYPENGNVR